MRDLATVLLRVLAVAMVFIGLLDALSMVFVILSVPDYPAWIAVLMLALYLAGCTGLYATAPRLAAAIAPLRPLPAPFPDARTLLAIGVVLIGAYLVLGGLGQFATYLPDVFSSISRMAADHSADFALSVTWQQLAPSGLNVVFGLGLLLWARHLAATPGRSDAGQVPEVHEPGMDGVG